MRVRVAVWRGWRFGAWLRASLADLRRAVPFLAAGVPRSFVSLMMLPVLAVLLLSAFGWVLVPKAAQALRWWAGIERRRVARFTGTPIGEYYPPLSGSLLEQVRTVVTDRATRRDVAWLAVHALPGTVMGLLAIGLPLGTINAAAIPLYWWAVPPEEAADALYPVTSWVGAMGMPVLAAVYAALSLILVPRFARWQTSWARALLSAPEGVRLTERVAELTASRAAALEAHGAELRRIERNLHDGAQNRLVGVVMHLGIVERALRRDPDSALPLVLRAQNAAGDALAELRDVVRSIYPPVLTERGLDGAVAALVARCPVPCTLTVDGLRRAPAAVESAAYFTVAEALTNVAKHSGAEHAEVRLAVSSRPLPPAGGRGSGPPPTSAQPEPGEDLLVIEVIDDGHGGADEDAGTGLVGIRRRVAAFDGHTELTSPPGGPTVLRAELPCGS